MSTSAVVTKNSLLLTKESMIDTMPFSHFYCGDYVPSRVEHKFHAHEKEATCVKYNSSGSLLATGGADAIIKIWDINR